MTPQDIIYEVLLRDHDIHHADQLANEIMGRLAWQGFVAVHASTVIQQDGKVSVTRRLVENVLEDAEAAMRREYIPGGLLHPAMMRRYERDMADILALRAELKEGKE